jgi:hypothetical protein
MRPAPCGRGKNRKDEKRGIEICQSGKGQLKNLRTLPALCNSDSVLWHKKGLGAQ